jgi:hypothetical protein
MLVLVMAGQAAVFPDGEHTAAAKAAARAYYKQSGMETDVRRIEREQVSKELRAYVGHAAVITKTIVEQRITLVWRFP